MPVIDRRSGKSEVPWQRSVERALANDDSALQALESSGKALTNTALNQVNALNAQVSNVGRYLGHYNETYTDSTSTSAMPPATNSIYISGQTVPMDRDNKDHATVTTVATFTWSVPLASNAKIGGNAFVALATADGTSQQTILIGPFLDFYQYELNQFAPTTYVAQATQTFSFAFDYATYPNTAYTNIVVGLLAQSTDSPSDFTTHQGRLDSAITTYYTVDAWRSA